MFNSFNINTTTIQYLKLAVFFLAELVSYSFKLLFYFCCLASELLTSLQDSSHTPNGVAMCVTHVMVQGLICRT